MNHQKVMALCVFSLSVVITGCDTWNVGEHSKSSANMSKHEKVCAKKWNRSPIRTINLFYDSRKRNIESQSDVVYYGKSANVGSNARCKIFMYVEANNVKKYFLIKEVDDLEAGSNAVGWEVIPRKASDEYNAKMNRNTGVIK